MVFMNPVSIWVSRLVAELAGDPMEGGGLTAPKEGVRNYDARICRAGRNGPGVATGNVPAIVEKRLVEIH